jgi:hypothetical protein
MSAARSTELHESPDSPFLAALAEAEYDDEPYTEEQQATVREGWEEYLRGETVPWEEFRRDLLEQDAPESS